MGNDTKWNFPYKKIYLLGDEVHIWRTKLSFTTKQINVFLSFLSNDEKNKALKFTFKSDSHNYIASRAILRLILSRYLNLLPTEIVFYQNYYGKPFVLNKNFGFNMSHSNEYVVYAVAENKMIGIDIEYIREGFEEMEIAERFFSQTEVQELKSIPQVLRKEAFFNCWTRKEAFIKAKGTGLSMPLDSFDVPINSGTSLDSIAFRNYDQEQNDWFLQNLHIAKGYSSAYVSQKKHNIIKYWDWNYTIEVIDRYTKAEKITMNSSKKASNAKILA